MDIIYTMSSCHEYNKRTSWFYFNPRYGILVRYMLYPLKYVHYYRQLHFSQIQKFYLFSYTKRKIILIN